MTCWGGKVKRNTEREKYKIIEGFIYPEGVYPLPEETNYDDTDKTWCIMTTRGVVDGLQTFGKGVGSMSWWSDNQKEIYTKDWNDFRYVKIIRIDGQPAGSNACILDEYRVKVHTIDTDPKQDIHTKLDGKKC